MPISTNKADLLAVFDRDYAKLEGTLSCVTEQIADLSAAGEDATIKAVVAHRAHWIGLFFTWYEGGVAERDVQTPAPGYKWNQLKAYNAPVYAAAAERSWPELMADFSAAAARLRAFIVESDDDHLYTKGLYPWMNTWTLGRWIEAAGPSHFRSARAYVRKVLRQSGGSKAAP